MATTEELSILISQAEFSALPPEVVEVAKTVILDGLGVTLAGSVEPPARIVADYVREMGGTPGCSVWGHNFKTSPVMAAFVNGVAGHVLDYEVMWYPATHATSPTLPGILALAESLFSALAIRAVRRAASDIIEEVRRQFREDPGIMQGTVRPDYARCVDITTRAGLREMILPGVIAVVLPIVVGVILKAEAVAAFLMVGTIGGIYMATVMNNSGGAWDNAKKFIEAGGLTNPHGEAMGKGSEAHAAAVVGDTVGDPFKDTAGPSLHVLVKLLSTITLVLAPIFI